MAETITSRDNDTVKYACKIARERAFRASEGLFLAEGFRLCEELARRHTPRMVFYTEAALAAHASLAGMGGEQYLVAPHVAEKLSETRAPQGVIALFALERGTLEEVHPTGRYLVLERVQNPDNVGAMLRSAAAFGFDGALLAPGCADAFCGKALRASMGAVGSLLLVENAPLADIFSVLRHPEMDVYAAAFENAEPLDAVQTNAARGVALLIGNEGAGLTDEAVQGAQTVVRIPMTQRVESLNAAAAAAVLLWHFRRV